VQTGKAIIVISLGVLIGTGLLYWYVTAHGFSARDKPNRVEAFLARNARKLATPPDAKTIQNPLSPTPLAVAEARDHFADHCAVCHANTGSGDTMINAGLYPPAPDMRKEDTQQLSDGELFYIIKNGIRFTGMPGWGGEDEENWKLVLFIRHLPELTREELALMQEVNGLEEQAEHEAQHSSQTANAD
jgi:mono/diheme cytochrome c family protein